MSQINDALKRLRQTPSSDESATEPPMGASPQPILHNSASSMPWMIPAVIVLLIVAGLCFMGVAMTHHPARKNKVQLTSVTPPAAQTTAPAQTKISSTPITAPVPSAVKAPAVEKTTTAVAAAQPTASVSIEMKPKLQGIFYSPTAPVAIVDGKTVRAGDQLSKYRVVEITKLSVTLAGADGKMLTLSLDN